MDPLFKQCGIYAHTGQLYEPVDSDQLLYYREAKDGQLLQEGISEAGSMASWMAAATTYSTHGKMLVPFYLYYSMFGFQRVGDQIWQAGDMCARGFLLGCTAGRTTLNGEGLQHEDGHSLLVASTNPAVIPYEPTYAYEIAFIVRDGLRRMAAGEDLIYYLTLQNEAYVMPPLPKGEDPAAVEEGVLKGLYLLRTASQLAAEQDKKLPAKAPRLQLLGSGSILAGVLQAQQTLLDEGIAADVWVATSYCQLRRDAIAADNARRHGQPDAESYLVQTLGATRGPILAASDWMRAVPDQIAPWLGGRLYSLGTDGFGMSDTREALRRHFEIDAEAVVDTARWLLIDRDQG